MDIYRVVISFMTAQHMQYMQERGALAMTPGQALDQVIDSLNIDKTRIHSFKTYVQKPETLQEFDRDAAMLVCIGSDMTVKDLWRRKYGDFLD